MGASREVVIVSGVRTAIGDYGGSLKDFHLVDLAASVVAEAIKRADVDASKIGQVVMGNVIHTDPRDMYLSRYAAVKGGIPIETPAYTLNRLCGSGLQAIVCAAQSILCGDTGIALGGGAESMSRSQYWLPSMRWGQRMNDGQVIDAMVGALSDPFDSCHMGVTAENVASRWEISREDQDQLAVESHQRAQRATEEGYFKEQILPISIKQRKQMISFEKDEHIRSDATTESMAKLKTVFKEDGSVTAGNASGLNDAASAVILMERSEAEKEGKEILGRLVGYAHSGVDPKYMGIGPVPAIQKCLESTGLTVKDMDVIELNEAFAAQTLAVARDLKLPMDRTNPNGSGISLGHPIGATGCLITVKLLYELKRIQG
ncbi:MAG: beta-ketothiolase BktB, partial [bacterium]